MKIQKETSEIKTLLLRSSPLEQVAIFCQLREILAFCAKINQNRAIDLQQLILLPLQAKLKQTLVLLEKK